MNYTQKCFACDNDCQGNKTTQINPLQIINNILEIYIER